MIKNFLKILFLSIYIFVICEVGIRIISNLTNIYEIEMLKYAKKLKKKSEDPNLSHEHIPNKKAKLMGTVIALNELGHRYNVENLKNLKKNDWEHAADYRIYIIGSSITLGWGVDSENTFANRLYTKLLNTLPLSFKKNIKVINGGVGNTNTKHHAALFKKKFHETRPDFLILQYFINDAEVINKKTNSIIIRYSNFAALLYQLIKSHSFKGTLVDYYNDLYKENSRGWVEAKESVKLIKNICEENNIKLAILFIPDFHNLSENNKLNKIYEKINDEFSMMGLDVINTFDALSKKFKSNSQKSWVSKDDPHPNSFAHEIIANEIYTYIMNRYPFF